MDAGITGISSMLLAQASRQSLWQYLVANADELWNKTVEHLLVLTLVPIALAIVIGVPAGVLIHRVARARRPVLAVASIIQTIPSLALLALLQIVLAQIGYTPAIIALTLYALLPIIRNTYTGLAGVPDEIIEASRGLGFSRWQRLWMVEAPLAVPVTVAGIRTAAVIVVGIATLATLIGAGGLGDFIVGGLSLANQRMILVGVVAAAALALLTDAAIGLIERLLTKGPRRAS